MIMMICSCSCHARRCGYVGIFAARLGAVLNRTHSILKSAVIEPLYSKSPRNLCRCGGDGYICVGAVVTVTDRADHIQHLQHNVNLNDLGHCTLFIKCQCPSIFTISNSPSRGFLRRVCRYWCVCVCVCVCGGRPKAVALYTVSQEQSISQ